MGIITTIIIDGIVLTSALAGIRRFTGWSAYRFIEPRIKNTSVRLATKKFLNIGEWIVDKTAEQFAKTASRGKDPLLEKSKSDTVGSLRRRRGRWD